MTIASEIREHMEVVGSDRSHVGTVDHLDGQRIKLTRTDADAGGKHHYLHLDSVDRIEGGQVVLNRTAAEAHEEWGVKEI